MRILIMLVLGLFAVGAFVLGVRFLWLTFHPSARTSGAPVVPVWLTGRAGQWLLLAAIALMIALAGYDILSTQDAPQEHQPPPTVVTPASNLKKPSRPAIDGQPATPESVGRKTPPSDR